MRLLFIDGGSRWKLDSLGQVYTDSTYSQEVWNRYLGFCDSFAALLRIENRVYLPEEATKSFNAVNNNRIESIGLVDIYNPKKNALSLRLRSMAKGIIVKEIQRADKVIIRSLGNFYTNTAAKYCLRHEVPFLVEVTGFVFESLWYHSVLGKIVAPIRELQYKLLMRRADYAVYVTKGALQKRYPCRGISIGCSDVELPCVDEGILQKRKPSATNLVLGTAAFLDVKWKGQAYVLKAMAKLKKKGITNIEYRLIGGGNGQRLLQLSNRLGIKDKVIIVGALSHDQVFEWLDAIDVYIQPSFQEGLCRSIVEAMSRGCPVICSKVGGNSELVPSECLFKKGSVKQIAQKIEMMTNVDNQKKYASLSIEKAKEYSRELLSAKRDGFYTNFINS